MPRKDRVRSAALFPLLAVIVACDRPQASPGDAASRTDQSDGAADSAASAVTDAAPRPPAEAKPKPKNHLAGETSPYLLMHVHNPVDWRPWGEAAFEKARREKKAIFLSIGYSSCFWCHVMERESFEDEEIAAFLNEHFVCIKVDREERPDVDDIYMTAVQLLTGHGGWPLSAFLTPAGKPFFGGTYFPARDGDRGVAKGFLSILKDVQIVWQEKSDLVRVRADQVADAVAKVMATEAAEERPELSPPMLDRVQAALAENFDPKHGGFGYDADQPQRPKFPEPPNLTFLLHRAQAGNDEATRMLLVTLEHMLQGGIRDHLGGGFHRYSTDRFWEIPHFEKMLYDNGQLATVYAEAYELTGREDFRRAARELLDFVLREMTGKDGGFYAALDAETDAVEGKFYRWSKEEIGAALGRDEYELFSLLYGLSGKPNFEEYYVPLLEKPLSEHAAERDMSEEALLAKLRPILSKLLAVRNERERPLTDTKILTSWNGLMIRGFADAGRVLDEPKYVEAAARAARFVLDKLRTEDGRLLRTYRSGQAKLNAYLDDYAFLVSGLIALHRATGDARWLEAAERITEKQIELFWDDEQGGFYYTSDDHEKLIARAKQATDGVLPSGNAVSAENLIYLAQAAAQPPHGKEAPTDGLENPSYVARARRTLEAFAHYLADESAAGSMPQMAVAAGKLLRSR